MILKLLKPREIRKFASVLNRAGLNFPQSISGSFSSYLDLLLTSKGVVTYQKQCVYTGQSIQVSAKSLIAYSQLQDFFRLWYLPLPMLDPSTDAYLSQRVPLTTYTYPTVIISCAGGGVVVITPGVWTASVLAHFLFIIQDWKTGSIIMKRGSFWLQVVVLGQGAKLHRIMDDWIWRQGRESHDKKQESGPPCLQQVGELALRSQEKESCLTSCTTWKSGPCTLPGQHSTTGPLE